MLTETDGNGKQVEVYINEHRLGTLAAADSAEFLPILAAARADDKPVAGQAVRDRGADGRWALHVYRPEPSFTGIAGLTWLRRVARWWHVRE